MGTPHAALELRLDNWSRWVRGGSWHAGRCASVEGRYTAPREDAERHERQSQAPVDRLDAEAVDVALRALPTLQRWCLVQWYSTRAPIRRFCRVLGMPARHLDAYRATCLYGLADALVAPRPALGHYSRQITELPSLTSTAA